MSKGKVLDLRAKKRPRVDEPDAEAGPPPRRRPKRRLDALGRGADFRAYLVDRMARLAGRPPEWVQAQFQLYHAVQTIETRLAGRMKLVERDTEKLAEQLVSEATVGEAPDSENDGV